MAPDAAPALFNKLTAATKGTKGSAFFSVEHCARLKGADGPKGVWLQCLTCCSAPDRRRRKKRQPRRLSAAHSVPAGQGRGPACWRRRHREATESVHRSGSCSTLAVAHAQLHAAAAYCMRLHACVPWVLACGLCPVPLYVCTIPVAPRPVLQS